MAIQQDGITYDNQKDEDLPKEKVGSYFITCILILIPLTHYCYTKGGQDIREEAEQGLAQGKGELLLHHVRSLVLLPLTHYCYTTGGQDTR